MLLVGYGQGVEWFSDLHKQGLLYSDTFTQDSTELDAKQLDRFTELYQTAYDEYLARIAK